MVPLPDWIIQVGAWGAIVIGILTFAERVEAIASQRLKLQSSNILKGLANPAKIVRALSLWVDNFCNIFDEIFGKKLLSIKFYFRATLASIVALVVAILTWGIFSPGDFVYVVVTKKFATNLPDIALANTLPTMLSIIETRYVLKYVQVVSSEWKRLLILILDAVLTAICGLILFSIFFYYFRQKYGWDDFNVLSTFIHGGVGIDAPGIVDTSVSGLVYFGAIIGPEGKVAPQIPIFVLWFVTTFFSSVWLWLYLMSMWLMRLLQQTGFGVRIFISFFNVDEKPIQALGALLAVVVTTLLLISAVII